MRSTRGPEIMVFDRLPFGLRLAKHCDYIRPYPRPSLSHLPALILPKTSTMKDADTPVFATGSACSVSKAMTFPQNEKHQDAPSRYDVDQCIQRATQYSKKIAHEDGHWYGELKANPTITAEYIFLHQALNTDTIPDNESLRQWLLSEQHSDGSWAIAPNHPGDISTTVEVYLALKIIGFSPKEKAMERARVFVLVNGGIERIRIFTRFYLAMFGLWSWSAVPEMPAELILVVHLIVVVLAFYGTSLTKKYRCQVGSPSISTIFHHGHAVPSYPC